MEENALAEQAELTMEAHVSTDIRVGNDEHFI
jgi:hypothetical protein